MCVRREGHGVCILSTIVLWFYCFLISSLGGDIIEGEYFDTTKMCVSAGISRPDRTGPWDLCEKRNWCHAE